MSASSRSTWQTPKDLSSAASNAATQPLGTCSECVNPPVLVQPKTPAGAASATAAAKSASTS